MLSRVVAALCALLVPAVALAQPPQLEYETVYESYNAPVFTTGALLFTASYGAGVIAAASAEDANRERGLDRLYIPIVGPWLALEGRGSCPIEEPRCDDETATKILLVADGIFQAAGVLAMVDGVLEPSSRRVPMREARATKVRVSPTASTGGPGLLVMGRF